MMQPYVGMPATINLYSDTFAAVVVKVNAKSIKVARVETDGNPVRINSERELFPCVAEQGILDKIIGEPERYAKVGERYRNGSISVTLGKSVKVTDYRY
jgi:hypothetical protein